ncbi:MAG TPA: CpaF family protein [Geminicoccaceae bacterium]|nr:CpaF family protein [Geminicoccaceae bacterium]
MFERFMNGAPHDPPAPLAGGPLLGTAAPPPALPAPAAPAAERPNRGAHNTQWLELKTRLHQRLLGILNLSAIDKVPAADLRREVATMVGEILAEEGVALNAKEFAQITDEILDEVLGLGPLEPLLKDPTVTDILVNTHQNVFVERRGKLELTPVRFKDERHLLRIIDKIVSGVGRRVDESQPWVDARLPDGSRVNAIVPPCALDGSLLSIRKFAKIPLTIDRLIENGALTRKMAELLAGIVKARLNLIISGGTGSGKTTMLNAASSFIGERERVLTIEDAAELQLQQFHVARLETRPSNIEGKGAVTQRDLVRNALRMRPDRIILGEIRGAEALDMLQAMNTGHDGSMTTIHANNCREAIGRLEQMLLMTGLDFPMRMIRAQIASAVDVVIQVERLSDGKRRLVSMHEITGMEGEVVTMQEIYRFRRTSVDAQGNVLGQFEATGIRPHFAERLATYGITLSSEMFETNRRLS